MTIDIDKLSEAELIDLNNRIVERLRFLHQMRAHKTMLNFSIGDRVAFEDQQGQTIEGTLTRYNKRSVTVIAHDVSRWAVLTIGTGLGNAHFTNREGTKVR
ncbi:hypothetical protein ACCS78_35895 [Rhizobium johnstonii]